VSKNKFDAIVGEGFIDGKKIMLVKPQTYMNLSGNCVSQILDFYQLVPEDIIVIYDDIDIELGKIRVRPSGSPGTHNGMRSIVNMLASEEFPRIRIGTDKPNYPISLADYVLKKLSKEEEEKLIQGTQKAVKAALMIIQKDVKAAMNEFNGI